MIKAARFFIFSLKLAAATCWAFAPLPARDINTLHTLIDSSRKTFDFSFATFRPLAKTRILRIDQLFSTAFDEPASAVNKENDSDAVNVVLVTGFESFNRDLYEQAGALLPVECKLNLQGTCI